MMAPMAKVEESVAGDLRREFPELFARSEAFDFAERLGGSTSASDREADAALRELWMARTNLALVAGDTTAPDLLQTLACIEEVLDSFEEMNARRVNPSRIVTDLIKLTRYQIESQT